MSNKGKKVKVHYTGTLDDGTKFDSSLDRGEPLEFTCMAGQMIPGFDAAVELMEQGETKTVHIPAADAYGERNEELVQRIPLDQIPNGGELPVAAGVGEDRNVSFGAGHLHSADEVAVDGQQHEFGPGEDRCLAVVSRGANLAGFLVQL